MLTLPESVAEELTPAYSKSEIQAVKEEIESEEKITDIEVILEGEKEEQKELDNLEKAIHQICMDEPELYATWIQSKRFKFLRGSSSGKRGRAVSRGSKAGTDIQRYRIQNQ